MDSRPAAEGKVPSESIQNPAREKEAGTQDSRTISQVSEIPRRGLDTQKTESLPRDRPRKEKLGNVEAHLDPGRERDKSTWLKAMTVETSPSWFVFLHV